MTVAGFSEADRSNWSTNTSYNEVRLLARPAVSLDICLTGAFVEFRGQSNEQLSEETFFRS